MPQNPWFTLIFYVLPVAVLLTCKYWIMRDIWDTDSPSKWGDFVNYYAAVSVIFWAVTSCAREFGVINF